jgi:excisionase family DNA binding protein
MVTGTKEGTMNVTEAARRLKVSRWHLYHLIQRGEVRATKHPTHRKGQIIDERDIRRIERAMVKAGV